MVEACDEDAVTEADEDIEQTLESPPPKSKSLPPLSDWHADFLSLSAPAFTRPATSDITKESKTTNIDQVAEQQDKISDVDGGDNGDVSDSDGDDDDDDDDDGDGEVEEQDDAISSVTHRYFGAASDSSSSDGDSDNENDAHGNVLGACIILRARYQSLESQ